MTEEESEARALYEVGKAVILWIVNNGMHDGISRKTPSAVEAVLLMALEINKLRKE